MVLELEVESLGACFLWVLRDSRNLSLALDTKRGQRGEGPRRVDSKARTARPLEVE